MKLSSQVLKSRSTTPLHVMEYLDLQNLGLVSVDQLNSPNVQFLNLHGNRLEDVTGLVSCQQVWHLDLGSNQLQCLEGFSRFLAIGTLIISNNQLEWRNLAHLRHMHILCLSLHGNPSLEKDPYYRMHVIDILPNVWMLDGRIITSAERIHVKQFFQDSALSDKPVRRKLKMGGFVPTNLKNIDVHGIFGNKAVCLMKSFPRNAILNIETDLKRLEYLAQNMEEDILLECHYSSRTSDSCHLKPGFLLNLLESRHSRVEGFNMVLLLLMASLEFVLPAHLIKQTIELEKLSRIGNVHTMSLFLLPRSLRSRVVSLLISAVKVDRDQNKDVGLYPKLCFAVYQLAEEFIKQSENVRIGNSHFSSGSKSDSYLNDCKCLLAAEVVKLMCRGPELFDYLNKEVGILNLIRSATGNIEIQEKLLQISGKLLENDNAKDISASAIVEEMVNFLLLKVQEQIDNLTNKITFISPRERILMKSGVVVIKGEDSSVSKVDYLVRGLGFPDDDSPVISAEVMSGRMRTKFPHLGDQLLLGPQTIGKIISLPQPTKALVLVDAVPMPSGAVERKLKETDDHYTYIDMEQLAWDMGISMWKPQNTVADMYTIQSVEDTPKSTGVEAVKDSFRPGTPEIGDLQTGAASRPLMFKTKQQPLFSAGSGEKSKVQRTQRPLTSVPKVQLKLSLDLRKRTQSARIRMHLVSSHNSSEQVQTITPASHTVFARDIGENGDGVGQQLIVHQSEVTVHKDISPTTKAHQEGMANDPLDSAGGVSAKDRSIRTSSNVADIETSSASFKSLATDLRSRAAELDSSPHKATSNPVTYNSQARARQSLALNKGNVPVIQGNEPDSKEVYPLSSMHVNQSTSRRGPHALKQTPSDHNNAASNVVPDKDFVQLQIQQIDQIGSGTAMAGKLLQQTQSVAKSSHITHSKDYMSMKENNHPKTGVRKGNAEIGFHTEFQQQRVNAWKRSAQKARHTKGLHSLLGPPPQRPTSPTNRRPDLAYDNLDNMKSSSSVQQKGALSMRVTYANLWLAGGRDLFQENLRKRPKSGHIPGWKEGLPDDMKKLRARSAAARTSRYFNTAGAGIVPASVNDETSFYGYASKKDLLELPDLNDYSLPVYLHNGISCRHSSQRTIYDEDPLPGPVKDNAYSPLVVWSYKQPFMYSYQAENYKQAWEDFEIDSSYKASYTIPNPA